MRARTNMFLLGAVVSLIATVLLHRLLPYTRAAERIFAYLEPTLLLLTILLGLLAAARRTFGIGGDRTVAGISFAIAIFGLDPYSYGYTGGHGGVQAAYAWQSAVTVGLSLLLLSAITSLKRGHSTAAQSMLVAEFLGYVLLNGFYLHRDAWTRLFAGEYASPMPLILLIAGLLTRIVIQIRQRRSRTARRHPPSPPSLTAKITR